MRHLSLRLSARAAGADRREAATDEIIRKLRQSINSLLLSEPDGDVSILVDAHMRVEPTPEFARGNDAG